MRAATGPDAGPVWTDQIRDDAGGDSDSWGIGIASGDRLRDAPPLAAGGRELLGVRERRVELLARRGALPALVFEPFGEARGPAKCSDLSLPRPQLLIREPLARA